MKKRALFPGTFDPVTLGHQDLILRFLPLFDEIVIGIGVNASKQPMFSLDQRKHWLETLFAPYPSIRIVAYEGLTTVFCRQEGLGYILRGIRTYSDFEYEKAIADMNHQLAPEIETMFLPSKSKWSALSSTLVRDVIRHGGELSAFLPPVVIDGI